MNDQFVWAIAAVGILFVIVSMYSLGRTRTQKSASRETARDHIERARKKQGVRDELEALMVDINRMAKDLGGQLDAKVVRIEQATREADQRIAQLQALRDELSQPNTLQPQADPSGSSNPASQDAPGAPDLMDPTNGADPLTREVYALADRGIGPNDIAQQLGEHVGKVELILALRTG